MFGIHTSHTVPQTPSMLLLHIPKSALTSIPKSRIWVSYHTMMLQIPRFAFEKFPGSKPELSTQMKSVGETMAMGRTFQESMQKALRSLETGLDGWSLPKNWKRMTDQQLIYGLRVPNPDRMIVMKQVCGSGDHRWFVRHNTQARFQWFRSIVPCISRLCNWRMI